MDMAQAKHDTTSRLLWDIADPILVMLHNSNCTEKRQLVKHGHYNPWSTRKHKAMAMPLTPDAVPVIKRAMGITN
jgi:hypothetical protein